MTVYYVTEFITEGMEENASGIYSTEQKAKDAILKRVAEEYTPEEMEQFDFDEEGTYITIGNKWVCGCTYYIDEIELDRDII